MLVREAASLIPEWKQGFSRLRMNNHLFDGARDEEDKMTYCHMEQVLTFRLEKQPL